MSAADQAKAKMNELANKATEQAKKAADFVKSNPYMTLTAAYAVTLLVLALVAVICLNKGMDEKKPRLDMMKHGKRATYGLVVMAVIGAGFIGYLYKEGYRMTKSA